MGPKRKKKVQANPARGFATTSIASKAKSERDVDSDGVSEPASTTAPTPAEPAVSSNTEHYKDLSKLSPDELERQLEENELQGLVEKHHQKVNRDSDRYLSRLRTDRRVLRSQAEPLYMRDWFDEELTNQVWDLLQRTIFEDKPNRVFLSSFASTDDLIVKLWTLQHILQGLRVDKQQVHSTLEWMCGHCPPSVSDSALWGLQECLEVLATNANVGDLLTYDKLPLPVSTNTSRASSRPGTPKPVEESMRPSSKAADPVSKGSEDPTRIGSDAEVSELDSDMEPDELVSKYLSIKSKIFDIDPGFFQLQKSSKGRKLAEKNLSPPKSIKLQTQLTKIERDMLFEQRTADQLWEERYLLLVKESVARRKLGLERSKESPTILNNPSEKDTARTDPLAKNGTDEDVENDILGGMFMEIEGETSSGTSQTNKASTTILRDFGDPKATQHPRKVLEELVRARDPDARLLYKLISPTTYASRHSISITWVKEQTISESPAISGISYEWISPRTLNMTMEGLSTPSEKQSEAYISTAALFLLCSIAWNDDKSYLRIAPAWRDLYREFIDSKRDGDFAQNRQDIKALRGLIDAQREKEEDEGVILTEGFRNRLMLKNGSKETGSRPSSPGVHIIQEVNDLRSLWESKSSSSAYYQMAQVRSMLPIFEFRDNILDAIDKSQITIVCAETGAGKSTQLPAYILEQQLSQGKPCRIFCTQPRRISAISLAQRVSAEFGEPKNALGTSASLVGYAIRLEANYVAETRLIYATVGIVLRMLEGASGLDDVTHLVIDEVHERGIDTDFLLIILKHLRLRKPDLRVILMSATIDAQRLSSYLGEAPILNIPGRTYPVQTHYLEDAVELTGYAQDETLAPNQEEENDEQDAASKSEMAISLQAYSPSTRKALASYDEYAIDYTLILKLIVKVSSDPSYQPYSNAFLVFLPGIAEIRRLNDLILSSAEFDNRWLVYPLHSTIASEDQQRAFLVPPEGMRKIVLATNIAETGVTIPDITCVIDTGKHREMRFDERRQLSRLVQSFISRANAKQRRGRAGRVQEGLCFHLFTKFRHDTLMVDHQTPEMLRLSLQDLVMRTKICQLGDIERTLAEALDPPSSKNVRRAIDALVEVGALTESEELTSLGTQLAKLPLDAYLGKLVLLSAVFSCVDSAITIAALLSSKSPFVTPFGAKQRADAARLAFSSADSDLLTEYRAYKTWRSICLTPGKSEAEFCRKNFLSSQNLSSIEDLKFQLLLSLVDTGLLSLTAAERNELLRSRSSRKRTFATVPPMYNANNENDLLTTSVIALAFHPHILTREGKGWRNISNNQYVTLSPTSVNKGSTSTNLKLLSYYNIMQGGNKLLTASHTSIVHPLPLLLMASDVGFNLYAGVVTLDGNRLRFSVRDGKTLLMLKHIRLKIREIIDFKLRKPGADLDSRQKRWFDIFLALFQWNGKA